jgi:ribosomal protein S12 methylthiotransferase
MRDGLILPYLDIPLQHASSRVLKAMKRPANGENTLARIQKWRSICPDITLRSTFIVGFPGETDAEFDELLDFLESAQLNRVGCFQYSPVEGARANALPDPVPDEVKAERYHRFMALQSEISRAQLKQKVGTQQEVLIDAINEKHVIARSMGDAPEIDGLVYLEPAAHLSVGTRVNATITDSDAYDLYGFVQI